MSRKINVVACPCCGFISLSERGGYDICGLCGWEDDPAQMDTPLMAFGPNHCSLFEAQQKALKGNYILDSLK